MWLRRHFLQVEKRFTSGVKKTNKQQQQQNVCTWKKVCRCRVTAAEASAAAFILSFLLLGSFAFVFQVWWVNTSQRLKFRFRRSFTLPKGPRWSWNASLWESRSTLQCQTRTLNRTREERDWDRYVSLRWIYQAACNSNNDEIILKSEMWSEEINVYCPPQPAFEWNIRVFYEIRGLSVFHVEKDGGIWDVNLMKIYLRLKTVLSGCKWFVW